MAKTNFQFHALENEINQIIRESAYKFNLCLISIQLFPKYNCILIFKDEFDEQIDILKNSRVLMLYNYTPDTSYDNYNQFVKNNGECLIIEIGKQNDGVLKESCISTMSIDVETTKMWKAIIKKFKSKMQKGAWVVNPMNGGKEYYKNHYYTVAAKNAYENGIKLAPFVGWNYYVLKETLPIELK